jgi:hypothetical protein
MHNAIDILAEVARIDENERWLRHYWLLRRIFLSYFCRLGRLYSAQVGRITSLGFNLVAIRSIFDLHMGIELRD